MSKYQFIDIKALVECIITSAIEINGYNGPDKQVKYEVDWDKDYQINIFEKSSNNDYDNDYDNGFITYNYPKNDEPLIVLYKESGLSKDFKKLTNLQIDNLSGWNRDPRVRSSTISDDDSDEEDWHKVKRDKNWFKNYSDTYNITKNEITLNDITNGVFSVKSGKLDNNYELFTNAWCNTIKNSDGNATLDITLKFDHGS